LKNLPESVDWREKGVLNPVKNQGGCGSCWAFAANAVLESHIAIQTGKLFDFAEQQLVSCVENPRHCGGAGGCKGATQPLAFDHALNGITQTKHYPYTARDDKCDSKKFKHVAKFGSTVQLTTNDYNHLLQTVATVGPVTISVDASNWSFYKSGIMNDCGPEINHAVVVVGYGPGYWIVRNSWGESWGEKGHIRLFREPDATTVQCEMDTNPASGSACDGETEPIKVCGTCGMYSDSSHVTDGELIE